MAGLFNSRSRWNLSSQPDPRQFCVYVHMRPDGTPFYVGKGLIRRAYDFAASRRTEWHKNIVAKYGREAIGVETIACISEREAFEVERQKIAEIRASGHVLVNLTDGGEGSAGHVSNERQLAALAIGRGKHRPYLTPEGKRNIREAHLRNMAAWKKTPEGQEHLRKLNEAGKTRLHSERAIICQECGKHHITKSAKARFCSRACEQRNRRARQG